MKMYFQAILCLSLALCAVQPAAAQLPSLNKAPWLGYFAGQQTKGCSLGVTLDGKINFNPTRDAESSGGSRSFTIIPAIEEITPDGKTVRRDLDPTTLESSQSGEAQIEKLTYIGNVRGGAKIEVTVEFNRKNFLIGGRVLDSGSNNNPKNVILVVHSPRFYGAYNNNVASMTEEQKAAHEKNEKALEKKVKGESLDLKLLNGKVVKQSILEPADLASAEISGVGISEIGMDFDLFNGSSPKLIASPNSGFNLNLKKDERVFKNQIHMHWRPDPEKDRESKARMVISFK